MPFTFSHPAAVLPLRRVPWLHLPAMIIGSLTPDLGYYIRYYPLADLAHTMSGALLTGIPAGFLLLAIFYSLRQVFADLLPEPIRTTLRGMVPPREFSLRSILLLAFSLGIGALTHILWDDFTHLSGRSVQRWEVLRSPAFQGLPLHYLLQQLSTVGGGIAVLLVTRSAFRRMAPKARFVWKEEKGRVARLAGLAVFSSVVACYVAYGAITSLHGWFAFRSFCFRAVTSGCATFVSLFLLLALLRALRKLTLREPA